VQVAVERKTRYTVLNWLPKRKAAHMRVALNRSLSRYPQGMRRTITYDNGGENADHKLTDKVLGTRSFFCTAYTAQERGTVENTAGLVRRKFPKKTSFGTVSPRQVKAVQYWLNHRPRKILGYKTPVEAFRAGVALTG
jgi:IS30 family transposase